MRPVQYMIVVLLGLVILWGALYFGYKVFFPYRDLRTVKRSAYVPALVKQMETARWLRAQGELAEAIFRDQ